MKTISLSGSFVWHAAEGCSVPIESVPGQRLGLPITLSNIHGVKLKAVKEGNVFYLTMHSTHFIYGYMASDIWLRTILIVRKETRCRHIGYSLRLTARVLLYAPFHRQDSTYHSLCYTSRGALAATTHRTMSEHPYHGATSRSLKAVVLVAHWLSRKVGRFWVHTLITASM